MGFNITQFLKDFNIVSSTEHHHCSPGWIQVHCPFCNDSNFHLGLPLNNPKVGNCWRCGKHSLWETIKQLLNCSGSRVYQLSQDYEMESSLYAAVKKNRTLPRVLKYPVGTSPLGDPHKRYLMSRGFDPEYLAREWGLLGTGPVGDYKHRIIIPIHYEGMVVSYIARDITGRSSIRYKTCPSTMEVRSHKHCLYGLDKVRGNEWVLVVEGPVDVWRMGPGIVATFGITWTREQILLLSRFNLTSILYDSEPQAQDQAQKLAYELSILNVDVEVIQQDLTKDPGELGEGDALELKRTIKERR